MSSRAIPASSLLPSGLFSALVLSWICACGPAPQPVDQAQASTPAPEPVTFEGVVRLQGELAQATGGALFLSIKPEGVRMPCYSHKYVLSDPGVATLDGDDKLIAFVLDEADLMGGIVPGPLVIEAWFDDDGFVETKENSVIETAPIEAGATGVEIVLVR